MTKTIQVDKMDNGFLVTCYTFDKEGDYHPVREIYSKESEVYSRMKELFASD